MTKNFRLQFKEMERPFSKKKKMMIDKALGPDSSIKRRAKGFLIKDLKDLPR